VSRGSGTTPEYAMHCESVSVQIVTHWATVKQSFDDELTSLVDWIPDTRSVMMNLFVYQLHQFFS